MIKQLIREEVSRTREDQGEDLINNRSSSIMQKVFSLSDFVNANTIFFYISFRGEVKTLEIIEEALSIGKRVVVAKVDKENKGLILSEIESLTELEPGFLGILEPKEIKEIKPEELDMVLVPGIAFDEKGNRVGYGKGYYDRFLRKIKNVPFIGLAYEVQMVNNIPSDKHDISVDKIITEERVIKCKEV